MSLYKTKHSLYHQRKNSKTCIYKLKVIIFIDSLGQICTYHLLIMQWYKLPIPPYYTYQ